MELPTQHSKWLDVANHLAPYVTGGILTFAAGTRMWWQAKQKIKQRITNLEILAENCVMKSDLIACRKDVDETLQELILPKFELLHDRITTTASEAAKGRQNILTTIIEMNSKND